MRREDNQEYHRLYAQICRIAKKEQWSNEQRLAELAKLRLPKPEIKTCTQCGKSETEVEFYKDQAECKLCNIDRSTEYTQKHKEEKQAYLKSYREEHKEKLRVVNKEYREEHKEELKTYNHLWREENAEYIKEKNRLWREKNKIHKAQQTLKWQRSRPDLVKAAKGRRRAHKANAAINDFTAAQWAELLEEYSYCCAYCFVSGVKLEQDHIVPISKGGNHTKDNIVPSCITCNRSKNDKELEEWLTVGLV